MSMFKDIPVDVGIVYEGERIRRPDMQVEFGGPDNKYKFELVRAKTMEEIKDGKITMVGPDISEMAEGSSHPFGIYIEVAGKQVEKDLEAVIERRIHEYCNFIEGFMHLNQRYDIWLRLSKASFKKGFNSFQYVGRVLQRLFKAELPIIEKIQTTFITDPEKVKEMWEGAMKIYEARDARARGMKDEDVDAFYGCVLCQSFAPTHVCVIAPNRVSLCGSINWFDARAAARVDPKGPNFKIEKGDLLNPVVGEYSGVDEAVKEKSLGEVTNVYMYSMFGHPHTSCGCFEAIAFYIPEVDGVGIVDRDFRGPTINGLPFSTMADQTGGGRQTEGFLGVSIEYMRSPRFIQADGGWNRVVWVPSRVKERVKSAIPPELVEKVATENDVKTIEELKTFLKERGHPVVEKWKEAPPIPMEVEEAAPPIEVAAPTMPSEVTVPTLPITAGGFKIILKNVKIHAEKVIIRSAEKKAGG